MKRILISITLAAAVLGACSNEKEATNEEKEVAVHEEQQTQEKVVEKEPEENLEPTKPTSATTGLEISEDQETNPFSVMIENSPSARPHTGLVDADIVYEFEVEGKITRFLAVFHDKTPDKVGPVRSSRHYYLPVAESFNVPYVHYGGSPQAYAALKDLKVPKYDGMKLAQHFKRDSSRKAPHNAYLYPNTLEKYERQIKSPFSFSSEDSKIGNIHEILYRYNNFTHVKYVFNKDTLLYTRFLEGSEHVDRETKEAIKVRNILFLTAKHTFIPGDKSGRINVQTKDGGKASLFTNGNRVEGTWEYKDGSYLFYDINSKPLNLNPGTTWVQVIRDNTSIVTN